MNFLIFCFTDYVCVMLNNLAAISSIEMGILCNEVMSQLEETYKVCVRRCYTGHFFTSLEMPGFSISVLRLTSSDIVNFLDATTQAPGWSGQAFPRRLERSGKPQKLPDPCAAINTETGSVNKGPEVGKFGHEATLKAVTFACEAIISCEDQLNTMDSGSGDSDCGSTLKRGAEAILNAVKEDPKITSRPSVLLHLISKVSSTWHFFFVKR